MSNGITASLPSSEERPSRVRYLIVGLATVMAIVLYLDRFCLSFTERYIKEDLGLSNDEIAWLLSAFSWTYALGQVPSGWLSDRFGARRMLALYILLWSAFTGLIGLAESFVALVVLRFGVGLAQAGAYPTSANLVSKWVPFSGRGLASGLISSGGRIGGVAAPLLTAYLMVAFVPLETSSLLEPDDLLDPSGFREALQKTGPPTGELNAWIRPWVESSGPAGPEDSTRDLSLLSGLNDVLRQRDLYEHIDLNHFSLPPEALRLGRLSAEQLTPERVQRRNRLLLEVAYPEYIRKVYGLGWRPVMIVYGLAGVVVAVLFWLCVRDRPEAHPLCNPAEVSLIESGRPAHSSSPHGQVGGLPVMLLLTNRSLWFSSISQFGTNFGWVFIMFWLPRYLMDVHHVPIEERGWMASAPIFVGMFGMLLGGWLTDRLTLALGLRWGRRLPMALTRFTATAGFIGCIVAEAPWPITVALCVVAVSTDLGTASVWAFMQDIGGRHVGSVLGFGNMWGNFGAALSPIVLNWIVKNYDWDTCFAACAAAFFVAGLAALRVDANEVIRVPDEPAAA